MHAQIKLTLVLFAGLIGGVLLASLGRAVADPEPSSNTASSAPGISGSRWEYATFDFVYVEDTPDWVVRFPTRKVFGEKNIDDLYRDLGPPLPNKDTATYLDVIERMGDAGWELAAFDQRAARVDNAYDQRWTFKRMKR